MACRPGRVLAVTARFSLFVTITPQLAAASLLQRRGARSDLAEWCRLCGFEPAQHHLYLIDKLQRVVRGEIKRLAFFLPPGSAKSTYSSVLFPPWFLAQRPNTALLACSHSADLAEAFGRRSRNLIIDKEKTLGYSLTEDSQAAGKWATTNGGEFFCAGVGGRIAGRRADLGLIDDPVGSKEDAYSELVRNKTWDWYNFDFRSRLKPDAAVVLIQTRWYEDDLAGRILASEGDEWTVVSIPLIAMEDDVLHRPPGQRLWPEYFNDKLVEDARKDDDVFNCLWQQNPLPETGDFFRREWIDPYTYTADQLPPTDELRFYCGSDHAVRPDEVNDNTAMVVAGLDTHDVLWFLPDIFWSKADTGEQVEQMLAMMKRRRPSCWWAGKDHISGSIGPFLYKRMRQERLHYVYLEETPSHNRRKRELAHSIQGMMKHGMVRWPSFAHWWPAARRELLSFDAGKHDDFVDAIALIGMGLNKMFGAEPKPLVEPEFKEFSKADMTLGWLKKSDARSRFSRELAKLGY